MEAGSGLPVSLTSIVGRADEVALLCRLLDERRLICVRVSVVPRDATVIADALGRQHRLVILDNCEHALESARHVAEVLVRRCAGVAVLSTSRQRLDLPGEHVVAVGPLSLIAEDGPPAAARLFVERARGVDLEFSPTDRDLAVIASICRQIDGLPLAIELAASWVRAFGLVELQRGASL